MPEPVRSQFTRRTILATVAVSILFLGLLIGEGRPWYCERGPGLWSAAWSHCTSQHLLDPYSPTHVLHGALFYWLLRPLAARLSLYWRMFAALALEIGWEVLEDSPWVVERYRQQSAALDYMGDSILNAMGDVATTGLGVVLASQFSWRISIAVFLAVELGLLYFVRDGLTLNVFMLLYPIETLKEWQLGAMGS